MSITGDQEEAGPLFWLDLEGRCGLRFTSLKAMDAGKQAPAGLASPLGLTFIRVRHIHSFDLSFMVHFVAAMVLSVNLQQRITSDCRYT